MRFDLTDLQLFINVCDAGTITGGARRTHITLASASERIRAMETTLGAPLLVRERRGVRLTPAGHSLAFHARTVVLQLDHMRQELGRYGSGLKGHIRLLCNTSALSEHLPLTLATFLAKHPNISVDIEEKPSSVIADSVRMGLTDIGVAANSTNLDGMQTHVVGPDPLVLVAPPRHPLARRRGLRLADLLEQDFVGLGADISLELLLTEQAKRLGRHLAYRARVRDFETVCRMVGLGAGVAIIPQAAAQRHAGATGIKSVALLDAWAAQRNSVLCVRDLAQLPAHAQQLVAHILDAGRRGLQARGR
jgi:DNA-binding transcriptional LysR family regulator